MRTVRRTVAAPEHAGMWLGAVPASIACLAAFVLLAALVHLRLLSGLDLAVAHAKQGLAGSGADLWAGVTDVLGAAEISSLYALIAALLLWRAGLGIWSLAPMAFAVPTLLELGLKLVIHQPSIPAELQRPTFYPLTSVNLAGTFPSGHATRTGFFCTLLAVLAWRQRRWTMRLASLGLLALAALAALARVYTGEHWLTDVIGGLLLGTSAALLVAPPVAARLRP